jgi:pimeloyl-ACP methyl ester carboxylesterase
MMISAGCGGYVARRMVQAPNSYPAWLSPAAPVELAFSSRFLTNFAPRTVDVGPPPAQLHYRIVDPADYQLEVTTTNWTRRARSQFKFSFKANIPGKPNPWTSTPRGTVVLLHGYGLAQYSTVPWALRLAEEGWRCVLVDLRGHGASTGPRVHFGLVETNDLSRLLDTLARDQQLVEPVAVLGDSYGAALALRWQSVEPRVGPIIAIAPYARLSSAVLNIRREYAAWFPKLFIQAGLRRLPRLLEVDPGELDTLTVLDRHPVDALFVAGAGDRIAPVADVLLISKQAGTGSRFLEIPGATHEALPYFFDDLVVPVLEWLDGGSGGYTQTRSARATP